VRHQTDKWNEDPLHASAITRSWDYRLVDRVAGLPGSQDLRFCNPDRDRRYINAKIMILQIVPLK
jgi:hypothetical protein